MEKSQIKELWSSSRVLSVSVSVIADLVALGSTTTSYAEDTVVLVAHNNHIEESSLRLQKSFYYIQRWLKNRESKLTGQN
jgi:hypothetical protein